MGNVRFALILVTLYCSKVAGNEETFLGDSLCIPAQKEPVPTNTGDCQPLIKLTKPFCEYYGVNLDRYVNVHVNHQQKLNNELWSYQEIVRWHNASYSTECMQQARFLACHSLFPGCDRSTSILRPKTFCKKSCLTFISKCSEMVKLWIKFQEEDPISNCSDKPQRSAGDIPECAFFASKLERLEKKGVMIDCLYLDGSSYTGNMFVTASGIPCQSWAEQCPHRHTMNGTYLELNLAQNFCRNPQSSGKRPWCFTTDRNKRWEYCDIPNCIPVSGAYGNWSLNSTCNVPCGEGFEIWIRECNKPKPKYGGRNCSYLGESIEHRRCSRKPCTGNHNFSKWAKSEDCNVTCGVGYETWFRKCDNHSSRNGGNCSKNGKDEERRICRMKPCSASSSSKSIKVIVGVCTSIFVLATALLLIRKTNIWLKIFKRNEIISPYAEYRPTSQEYSPLASVPIDDTTGENIYEEIPDVLNPTTTTECIYENII